MSSALNQNNAGVCCLECVRFSSNAARAGIAQEPAGCAIAPLAPSLGYSPLFLILAAGRSVPPWPRSKATEAV